MIKAHQEDFGLKWRHIPTKTQAPNVAPDAETSVPTPDSHDPKTLPLP
jgi:hypothetical protein